MENSIFTVTICKMLTGLVGTIYSIVLWGKTPDIHCYWYCHMSKKNTIFSRILTLKELFDAFQQHWEKFPLVFTERTITECKGTSYCGWPLCLYDAVREKLFPTATYRTIGSQKRELSHVTRQVCSGLHARTSYLNRDKNAIHKWSRTVEVMDGYYLTGIKPLFGWRIMSWLWLCSLKVK